MRIVLGRCALGSDKKTRTVMEDAIGMDNDDDGDGINDGVELRCSTDPLDSLSVPLDTDGDGKIFQFETLLTKTMMATPGSIEKKRRVVPTQSVQHRFQWMSMETQFATI